MTLETAIALFALLVSLVAAVYARRANDQSRLNALLALRTHYLALMDHQGKLAEFLSNLPSGLKAAQDSYADLDTKLREVSREIDTYHVSLVGSRT